MICLRNQSWIFMFGHKAYTSFIHSLVFIIDRASCVNRHWIAPLSLFLIYWVERLFEREPSSLWDGVIWFCATIRLSGHNSELSDHVSHTPHSSGGQETTLSATAAVELFCLVSVAMAMCRASKNASPRCRILRNPPADARPGQRNLLPHPC